jgi:hypothetical protein
MKMPLTASVSLMAAFFWSAAWSNDATIGSADGVSYEITSGIEISLPAVECGFNDLGLPLPGTYSRQTRHYRSFSSGKLNREWDETADVFKECASP